MPQPQASFGIVCDGAQYSFGRKHIHHCSCFLGSMLVNPGDHRDQRARFDILFFIVFTSCVFYDWITVFIKKGSHTAYPYAA